MHKTTYLLALTAVLSACSTESTTTKSAADEHGCKSATGYHWSAVQQKCVRLSEAGIKLASTGPDTAQTAYLLFASSDEDEQAEVFLPGQPGRILAKKPGDDAGTWTLDTLTLSHWKGMYSLSGAKETLLYEGHIVVEEAAAADSLLGDSDVPTMLMGSWQRVDDPKERFVIAGKTLTQYYDGKKGPVQTFAYVPDCGGTACAGHQGPYGCLTTAGQFDIDCQTIGVITTTELTLSVGTTGSTTRYQKLNRSN
jgi:hypothetical protein